MARGSTTTLGFACVGVGGLLGVAGITGSSIHSVLQGNPDKSKQGSQGGGEGGEAASLTAPPIGKGKFKSALEWAHKEIGNPYRWGGSEPGGFDCSGLVQYIYGRVGVRLPRTAQEQYNATRRLRPGEQLLPGDLVFFGSSPSDITHVGIYAGENKMIDAPHTGANVRVEQIPLTPGASWGTDTLIGFGEP